jgi:predicted Zn-ribbon and HTH transcriptional regulator
MSSVVLLIIFITLALALTALILAVQFSNDLFVAGWLALIGIAGIVLSVYVILQMRRHGSRPSIEVAPIMTTIECKKCGYKNVREFKRGDYIFKEAEPCPKCNEKMMITAIYREVKEKDKEKERSRV